MRWKHTVWVAVVAASIGFQTAAQETPPARTCQAVHADLVEDLATTACRSGHTSCYIGSVEGNQQLRGTTYFKADGGTTATTAFQKIIGATSEFTGRTGHAFVYGFNINGHVVTKVSGEICAPER